MSPPLRSFRLLPLPAKIHPQGILLFLFIPIVLFLFLQHPFSIPYSFLAAICIMIAHRFVARAFFLWNKSRRCFWCGKTSSPRVPMEINSGEPIIIELCNPFCKEPAKRFFDFCCRYRMFLRAGIFAPLIWYIVTMLLSYYGIFRFSSEWNHFIFRFPIALSVVTVSFAYRTGKPRKHAVFPFPIHNLFLIGARNTLLVFRYVGIWWLIASIHFLFTP